MSGAVEFLDLAAEAAEIGVELRERVERVLTSCAYVLGPQTAELESRLAELLEVEHAVACSSGSDALYLALAAHDIGPGDAVLVPSFTFFATAGAVARTGARAVFCDVDPDGYLMTAAGAEAAVAREFRHGPDSVARHRHDDSLLRAVVPVHLYGRSVDMVGLSAWAAARGLVVIGDAAQAVGARGAEGSVAAWGHVACLSFYPTKNLGAAGDGGMLTTNDEALATRLRRLRVHGVEGGAYEHREIGINARMGELQAASVLAKLDRWPAWTDRRRRIADLYGQALAEAAADGRLRLPGVSAPPARDVWHQYAVALPRGRDEVARRLAERGIATRVFYPKPLHRQACFADLGYEAGDLPVSEAAAAEVLCLPVHPFLADRDVATVAAALTEALEVCAR